MDAKHSILLIDDHPLILKGYQNVLSHFFKENLYIEAAINCDLGWEKLENSEFNLVLLDLNFQCLDRVHIRSGEDLGIKLRETYPKLKIIVITYITDTFRLQNILNTINPDGFLIKNETTSEELTICVQSVLNDSTYYGDKITQIIKNIITSKFTLDDLDKMILLQLSLGSKTKDISKYVPLSLRAIENRKRRLKEIFNVKASGDRELLEQAKKSGYI